MSIGIPTYLTFRKITKEQGTGQSMVLWELGGEVGIFGWFLKESMTCLIEALALLKRKIFPGCHGFFRKGEIRRCVRGLNFAVSPCFMEMPLGAPSTKIPHFSKASFPSYPFRSTHRKGPFCLLP